MGRMNARSPWEESHGCSAARTAAACGPRSHPCQPRGDERGAGARGLPPARALQHAHDAALRPSRRPRYRTGRGRWSLAVSDPADGDPGQAALADPSPSTAPGGGEIPDTGSAKGGEPAGPSDPGQGGDGDPQAGAPTSAAVELPATVKFFDPARGFGFVIPDTGGREVFVHSSVLFRSGMTDLAPGQRVFVRAESAPRGLQATEIERKPPA